MKNILSYMYTGKSLSVVFKNAQGKIESKIADSSHPQWMAINKAFASKQLEKVVKLMDISQVINTGMRGKFVCKGGKVFRGDKPVSGYLFDKIIQFVKEGLPFDRLLKFAENLYANPSERAHKDLYAFLEHGNFPITEDGCFLAYKGVKHDFYSITGGELKLLSGKANQSGQIFNGIGEIIEVDRTDVNPNSNETCSYGLHAGSFQYANSFRGDGKLIIVKINPKDVVAIPTDHSSQKLRTARYEVIREEGKPLHEVKNSNLDKVSKIRQGRLANGQFAKKS